MYRSASDSPDRLDKADRSAETGDEFVERDLSGTASTMSLSVTWRRCLVVVAVAVAWFAAADDAAAGLCWVEEAVDDDGAAAAGRGSWMCGTCTAAAG